ncbi:2-C-methyl-D-erythritol 4-phosphate cytidylyltransferase [bacterium]|nr:2-C-methyl-D-erythritol 4-phosphate cytidylyltransferase [bacterium]
MRVCALVPNAGFGARMKAALPKQYLDLGSKPVLIHTLNILDKTKCIDEIILISGKKYIEKSRLLIQKHNIRKVSKIVCGGKTRQESVYNGLMGIKNTPDIILIHDAVRPFITSELIRKSIEAAHKHGAAVIGLPLFDTIKLVKDNCIEKTVDRNNLWRVQTPQVFRYDLIKTAYQKANKNKFSGTDDASLVEQLNYPVRIVPGSETNIKITDQKQFKLFGGNCKCESE